MTANVLAPRPLTSRQANAALLIRKGLEDNRSFSSDLLIESHLVAYGLGNDRKRASTYCSANMKLEGFRSELSLDSPETRQVLNQTLWRCLLGTHPGFPNDKQLLLTALRLLVRLMYPERREKAKHEDDFAGRPVEDLEYFAMNGRWPPAGSFD